MRCGRGGNECCPLLAAKWRFGIRTLEIAVYSQTGLRLEHTQVESMTEMSSFESSGEEELGEGVESSQAEGGELGKEQGREQWNRSL